MGKIDYIRLFEKYLQGQASPEEIRILIHWLDKGSSFQNQMDEEWSAASSRMDRKLQRKLWNRIQEKTNPEYKPQAMSKPDRPRWFPLWTGRAASIILIVLLAGLSVYHYAKKQPETHDLVVSVERGQKANVVLPDGSRVWINSDSHLSYGNRFNAQERVLALEGEAYFEVSPDKGRPFIVETKDLSVKALGTAFNVKAYGEEKDVSAVLMTGKVEVASKNGHLVLQPNERVILDKQSGLMTKAVVEDASDYVSWKHNALAFNGETFEQIAHTLERYYNTHILFESDSLKKYRFTGTPHNTSLESILQILSLTSPLSYEVRDSVILLRENIKQKAYYEKALK